MIGKLFNNLIYIIFKLYTIYWFLTFAEDIFFDENLEAKHLLTQNQRWSELLGIQYKYTLPGILHPNNFAAYRWTAAKAIAYIYTLGVMVPLFGGCRLRTQFFKIVLGLLCLAYAALHLHPWLSENPKSVGAEPATRFIVAYLSHGALALLTL